ncbi:MAG: cob(I)yrinic acid a,c-diamide adenosyltransferase [Candidatus Omnitrophica bacterium]|nr:cob(I)yrinic acid a,c-diamide adenosyltransferase [Candidatus Omnitrophota bacterium]MDD5591751.1 cob(I)yrinic acid a,c-diamide adenosyltransferase [Candidatus Omnitrophota bacterium]
MIQVYTGNGKGKTTAALGQALRAAGGGLKIYICQFLKNGCYCELTAIKKFKNIKVEQFGRAFFIRKNPAQKDRELAKRGLNKAKEIICAGYYDVVILDEINPALKLGLLELRDVISLIKSAPGKTELILTGRQAHPEIVKAADLVSEIKEVKHYYKKGVKARKGIEF